MNKLAAYFNFLPVQMRERKYAITIDEYFKAQSSILPHCYIQ
jgi:hypothetical protein